VSRLARPGQIWLIDLGTPIGSEQCGRRPGMVVGSELHCSFPIGMVLVAPCTTVDRGLPHYVAIDWRAAGLERPTWVRTEDVRAVSERRLVRPEPLGQVPLADQARIGRFVRLMLVD
jgi:mRNA interferase MazF